MLWLQAGGRLPPAGWVGVVDVLCWRQDGSVSHVTAAVFHGDFILCHSLDHVVAMAAGHTFPVQHDAALNAKHHSTQKQHGVGSRRRCAAAAFFPSH